MCKPDPERGIVVTGLGVVSPIGIGAEAFWDSLAAGRSGARIRDEFADTDLPLRFYAPVTGFEGKQWIKPRKAIKVMCEPIQYGCAAARMAAEQAGIVEGGVFNPDRIGTVFGSETFFSHPRNVADVFQACNENGAYVHDRWGESAMREIEPLWMLKYLPNMSTSHVSIAVDARGPSNTICQREVSGLLALIEGMSLIRRGLCDAVVVGGTGSSTSLTVNLYHGMQLLCAPGEDPTRACRPFEKNRSGTIFGEGAGAIVLESEEHALNRNAEIKCRIAGASRSFCSDSGNKFSQAIAANLAETMQSAQIDRSELGHFNSHGWGSPHFDQLEAVAINSVAGDVPTLGLKSYFGFLGAGSSIVELLASILAIENRNLPKTLNYEEPDPACPCNVRSENEAISKGTGIKLAYSLHGQITSVAIRA